MSTLAPTVRVLAILALLLPSIAQASPAPISGDGSRLLTADGRPHFLLAVNYEGPADRAWEMWDEGKYDPALIEADFKRATTAGVQALRVFVQLSLAREINAGKWGKLDTIVDLAEKHNLQLIVALYDYTERDIAKVATTAGAVAEHYRNRKGILSYDLRNEPRFGDLALTRYPQLAPYQTQKLIDTYGERISKAEIPEYRASDAGRVEVPAAYTDDQAWIYVNNLRYYREFLAEAGEWVRSKGFIPTTLDYMDDEEGRKWDTLYSVLDDTLRAWLTPQVNAIRKADPGKPITVGHVDAVLARLSSNSLLDYHTLHRYPGQTAAGLRGALGLVGKLQQVLPNSPHVLGEFGFATDTTAPENTAIMETAVQIGLAAQGAGGAAKWMLNDMPDGFNMRERTLGSFFPDGSPKPVVAATAALGRYLRTSGAAGGELKMDDESGSGVRYTYKASDALLMGGKQVDGGGAKLTADTPTQLFLTWTEPGTIELWTSAPAQLDVAFDKLLPGREVGAVTAVRLNGTAEAPIQSTRIGSNLAVKLDQPGTYRLKLGAAAKPANYEIANGQFFTQTNGREGSKSGFSVTNADNIPFWTTFQQRGGVDVLGYPVTRRFVHDGFVTQAFQKVVLQWRPDQGNQVLFFNTFDVLHDRGKDYWLQTFRQTPPPEDTAPDGGQPWDKVVARHVAFLDKVPAPLKERFLSNPSWLDHYGLPVSTAEYSTSVVVRAQRATFQYWKEDVPWAKKGEISVANGGDLAKEAGLWPAQAATPENAPW